MEKASKFSIDILRDEFRDYVDQDHLKDIKIQMKKLEKFTQSEIFEMKEHLNAYKRELNGDIIISLRKFSNEVNSHLHNDQAEAIVTKREFEQRLNLKIDKLDFDSTNKNKADLVKLNEWNKLLIKTHDQLSHTLIILIEWLKIFIATPNETENAISSKLNYWLKQAMSIYNWTDKSIENIVNDSTIIVTNRIPITKRSRDPSPLQIDIIDVNNDDATKPNKLNLTLNSPISIKKLN